MTGVVVTPRDELESIVEGQLAGADLVTQLLEERHASAVREEHLLAGGVCSAANWCEVAQKVQASGADRALARASLLSYELSVESVTREDAERAALLWTMGSGLSLADRLCLAPRIDLPQQCGRRMMLGTPSPTSS